MKTKGAKIMILFSLLSMMIVMLFNSNFREQANETKQINLVLKSKYGSEWEQVRAGANAAANEYGAELIILAPDYDKDVNAQMNLLESIDKEKSSAIIVAPMESAIIATSTSDVNNKGIPIMNIVSEGDEEVFYSSVLTNYAQMGSLLASLMKETIGSDGELLIVSSEEMSPNTIKKLEAITKYFSENSTITIKKILYTQPDIFSAKRVCKVAIVEQSFDGIIALDGIGTIGVANALKEASILVPVIGSNVFDEELALIEEGFINQVVNENFFAIGYFSVENTMKMLSKKGYSARRQIPPFSFDQDSMYKDTIEPIVFPIK